MQIREAGCTCIYHCSWAIHDRSFKDLISRSRLFLFGSELITQKNASINCESSSQTNPNPQQNRTFPRPKSASKLLLYHRLHKPCLGRDFASLARLARRTSAWPSELRQRQALPPCLGDGMAPAQAYGVQGRPRRCGRSTINEINSRNM